MALHAYILKHTLTNNAGITSMRKAKKKTTQLRYAKIRKDYEKLTSIKESGVRKYTEDYVLTRLSKNHFLSVKTVEDIICNRV